ncbi:MAG: hypothetical protein WC858_02055 [Parcubacteria group bacterium]
MKKAIISRSRRIMLSLILVFSIAAVASIVKVQAAGIITGWLWGGTEESSDGSINGNETGVYWVSMNSKNCDVNENGTYEGSSEGAPAGCPTSGAVKLYRVNIPSPTSGGELSGYAWSPGLGYISFNSSELGGCPSNPCKAWRTGNRIKGWARFLEIKKEFEKATPNSGGWQGWISLEGNANGTPYGITINNDNTLSGYGWSGTNSAIAGELGWIDFGQAKIENVCAIHSASGPTLDHIQNCRPLVVTTEDSTDGQVVNFSDNGSAKIDISSNSTCSGAADSTSCAISGGECTVYVKGIDFSSNDTVPVNVTGDCGAATANVNLIKTLDCEVSCPDSFEVRSGSTASYDVSVTGEAGCALETCIKKVGGSTNITDVSKDGTQCKVTADSSSNYGSATSDAVAGDDSCSTKVYVKAPGWVETNPTQ